jgi:DNA-directed RNA polymerase specialized sigma24 family protein
MLATENAEPWGTEDISKIVYSAARRVGGRFRGYVELDDLLQEAWLCVCASDKVLAEWQEQGEAGKGRLTRAVMKACTLYAQKAKAAKLGYRHSDLFYYGPKLFRHMITLILETLGQEDAYSDFSDRSVWLDVENALLTLSDSDYQIIWWAFKGDLDEEEGYANVASHLGLSNDAARQRVNRILRRMQNTLGGENPSPRRRPRSNAAALAETRNAWEGEG